MRATNRSSSVVNCPLKARGNRAQLTGLIPSGRTPHPDTERQVSFRYRCRECSHSRYVDRDLGDSRPLALHHEREPTLNRFLTLVGGLAALIVAVLIWGSPDSSGESPDTSDVADSASQSALAASDGAQIVAEVDVAPTDDGFLVVTESGQQAGPDTAPLVRYTIEVEPTLRHYATSLQDLADTALLNEQSGWTAKGERRLQQTADPTSADIRVVLATPATVDQRCAVNGLLTRGTLSCWDGSRAMLNLTRWLEGAEDFQSLLRYRTYLVNHEFGHGLGRGHEYCSEPGAPAPVMMQQSKDVAQCQPNGLPHP
jgi:hypothetical protein